MRIDLHFSRLSVPLIAGAFLVVCPLVLPAQQNGPDSADQSTTAPDTQSAPQAPAPQQTSPSPASAAASPLTSAPLSAAPVSAAQIGTISGTVTDAQDEVVPGAVVALGGADPDDSRKTVANDLGAFQFEGLRPNVTYHLTIQAKGFVDWKSSPIVLAPGQFQFVPGIRLELSGEATSVTVYASSAELATEQVKILEQQRILGIVPNFYVAYDPNAPPLTAKQKFHLAIRVSADPITLVGVFFLAGVNQGVELPDYALGAKGYGERVGAVAADGFTDIFFGGAVLPALLHQDPRYFYQGTGTKKSRLLHALAGPFVCRGDNGRTEPNYSTVGGDIISAGFSDLYYPRIDRNGKIFAENIMISTIERTASTVTQEFVLRRLTFGAKGRKSTPDADQQ
jgi:Carboxypeptidase regulatory-like domain